MVNLLFYYIDMEKQDLKVYTYVFINCLNGGVFFACNKWSGFFEKNSATST